MKKQLLFVALSCVGFAYGLAQKEPMGTFTNKTTDKTIKVTVHYKNGLPVAMAEQMVHPSASMKGIYVDRVERITVDGKPYTDAISERMVYVGNTKDNGKHANGVKANENGLRLNRMNGNDY